jgi:hypothetical protein
MVAPSVRRAGKVATCCLPRAKVNCTLGPFPVHSTLYLPGSRVFPSTMIFSVRLMLDLLVSPAIAGAENRRAEPAESSRFL